MTKIFQPILGQTIEVYIDDMLIKSREMVEHSHDLEKHSSY